MRRTWAAAALAVTAALGGAGAARAQAPDPCATPAADASSATLTAHGVALMYGECGPPNPYAAAALFERAIEDDSWSWWGRTWAVRALADARLAQGQDPGSVEPLLQRLREAQSHQVMSGNSAPPQGQRVFFDHALGWVRYRQGQVDEAVRLWRSITGPRHWLEPTPGFFFADLGDAYADLGQHDAAQAYWRHALAARWRPQDTGWDRERTARRLAESVAAHGAAAQWPTRNRAGWVTTVPSRAVIDAGGMTRDGQVVSYSIYTLLAQDRDGVAWQREDWRGDCGEPLRLLRPYGGRFAADGTEVNSWTEDWWIDTSERNSLQDTELALMCSLSLEAEGIPAVPADPAALLAAYRASAKSD